MEEKSLELGAAGWVGFRQERLIEEGTPGRGSLEQKGPSHTSAWRLHPSPPHLYGSLAPGRMVHTDLDFDSGVSFFDSQGWFWQNY